MIADEQREDGGPTAVFTEMGGVARTPELRRQAHRQNVSFARDCPLHMEATTRADTDDLLIALRHPLRREILQAMAAGPSRSAPDLAGTLNQPLSNVSYHVRVLVECGRLGPGRDATGTWVDAALLPLLAGYGVGAVRPWNRRQRFLRRWRTGEEKG